MLYLLALAPLVVLDFAWLSLTSGFYRGALAHLFAPTLSFAPAFVYYPLYAAGMLFFVLQPAIREGTGLPGVIFAGALLGLVAYGAYDLTNQATMKDWPILITIVDMAWGAFVTAAASAIAFLLYTYFT